jgi:hypothetical protein
MGLLAKKLRTFDYFTIGFGTMVGVGWLVIMDDWLARGGYLGAILGFAIGGISLLPIAYVYGRLVARLPDAGSEITYTALVFPTQVSFATGWIMMLGYLVVCPWEAIAVGKIAGYIFPSMNTLELYRVAESHPPVPSRHRSRADDRHHHVNYRGVELSARFHELTTVGLLILTTFSVPTSQGISGKSVVPFSHGGLISVLLVVQIVPYHGRIRVGREVFRRSSDQASPLRSFSCDGRRDRGWYYLLHPVIASWLIFTLGVLCSDTVLPPAPRLKPLSVSAGSCRLFSWRPFFHCSKCSMEISWPQADCCLHSDVRI